MDIKSWMSRIFVGFRKRKKSELIEDVNANIYI